MPKIKTHKGAQHRFHITGSGKVLRHKVGKSHLRRNKPARVKRQYKGMQPVHPSARTRVQHLLPNA